MDASRFVFLDETGLTTKMTRLYGRSRRGERLVGAVPHGHWRTTTFITGLRQSGIIAPMVLDGPMTGAAFRAYVEQALTPALQPGDVVVMSAPRSSGWAMDALNPVYEAHPVSVSVTARRRFPSRAPPSRIQGMAMTLPLRIVQASATAAAQQLCAAPMRASVGSRSRFAPAPPSGE